MRKTRAAVLDCERGRTFRFVPDNLGRDERSKMPIPRQDDGDGPEGPTPLSPLPWIVRGVEPLGSSPTPWGGKDKARCSSFGKMMGTETNTGQFRRNRPVFVPCVDQRFAVFERLCDPA